MTSCISFRLALAIAFISFGSGYQKRTKDMFLCYGGDQELVVTSYTDASWDTDPVDSKPQSGYDNPQV